jgi:hypothetical protein
MIGEEFGDNWRTGRLNRGREHERDLTHRQTRATSFKREKEMKGKRVTSENNREEGIGKDWGPERGKQTTTTSLIQSKRAERKKMEGNRE